ncbi:hypothetical protein D021_4501A, partial [Vibrio parahaemolyticus 10296]
MLVMEPNLVALYGLLLLDIPYRGVERSRRRCS